jgi:hypothetical protein
LIDTPVGGPDREAFAASSVRSTEIYDELEFRTAPPYPCFVLYRFPVTRSHWILGGCFGDAFDDAARDVAASPHVGQRLREMAEVWPVFVKLSASGDLEDLSDAALTRIHDPDDGLRKWLVATQCEAPRDRSAITDDARGAASRVIHWSVRVLDEWLGTKVPAALRLSVADDPNADLDDVFRSRLSGSSTLSRLGHRLLSMSPLVTSFDNLSFLWLSPHHAE